MRAFAGVVCSLLLLSCSPIAPGESPSASNDPTPMPSPTSRVVPASPPPSAAAGVPMCDDVPVPTAPVAWYRDSPIYVADERPLTELRAWAMVRPGFETLWIDGEHLGWVALAFSSDAEARQRELRTDFPDAGAVVVAVDWTMEELRALERRAANALPEIILAANARDRQGVVGLSIGELSRERIAAVNEHFGGERVCVEGVDPAVLPSPGPQPAEGDGWRLLGEGDGVGPAYRTGIAWDHSSYAELWETTALSADPPAVDFQSEIVIWFGAVTGSRCPPMRMEEITVDRGTGVVYPHIVHIGFGSCTDDIHPHAYVVAFDRIRLPAPPFKIALDSDALLGEETIVKADLSIPGSVPGPGGVRNDDTRPNPQPPGPGTYYEAGYESLYRQSTHCGVEWLGPINSVYWQTAQADSADWLPRQWNAAVDGGYVTLRVLIATGDPPTLRATADGHTVLYTASADEPPDCD